MFKAQFVVKVDPDPYPRSGSSVILLTKKDIPDFLNLQQQVWNELPLRKKDHLNVFSVQELLDHLDAGMPLLAVRGEDGKLLAQGALSFPRDNKGRDYQQDHPMLQDYDDNISFFESIAVRPDVASQHYGDMILAKGQELAMQQKSPGILAMASDEEVLGCGALERMGFIQTVCKIDYGIDIPVVYAQWVKFGEGEERFMDPNNYPQYMYDIG